MFVPEEEKDRLQFTMAEKQAMIEFMELNPAICSVKLIKHYDTAYRNYKWALLSQMLNNLTGGKPKPVKKYKQLWRSWRLNVIRKDPNKLTRLEERFLMVTLVNDYPIPDKKVKLQNVVLENALEGNPNPQIENLQTFYNHDLLDTEENPLLQLCESNFVENPSINNDNISMFSLEPISSFSDNKFLMPTAISKKSPNKTVPEISTPSTEKKEIEILTPSKKKDLHKKKLVPLTLSKKNNSSERKSLSQIQMNNSEILTSKISKRRAPEVVISLEKITLPEINKYKRLTTPEKNISSSEVSSTLDNTTHSKRKGSEISNKPKGKKRKILASSQKPNQPRKKKPNRFRSPAGSNLLQIQKLSKSVEKTAATLKEFSATQEKTSLKIVSLLEDTSKSLQNLGDLQMRQAEALERQVSLLESQNFLLKHIASALTSNNKE